MLPRSIARVRIAKFLTQIWKFPEPAVRTSGSHRRVIEEAHNEISPLCSECFIVVDRYRVWQHAECDGYCGADWRPAARFTARAGRRWRRRRVQLQKDPARLPNRASERLHSESDPSKPRLGSRRLRVLARNVG